MPQHCTVSVYPRPPAVYLERYCFQDGNVTVRGLPCSQVPLGRRFSPVLTEEQHFSPERLVQQLAAKGAEVSAGSGTSPTSHAYSLSDI